MRKLRMMLPLVIVAGAIVGVVTIAARADKPTSPPGQSKPEPEPVLVSVAGAMEGQGDPYEISITFLDDSFGELAGSYVANPDYPPALKVGGPGRVNKRLMYYYCDGSHESSALCDVESHDPANYKCLMIYDGVEDKKTGQIIFPAGSPWRVTQKVITGGVVSGEVVAVDTLAEQVTYEVQKYGTP
jgi:hypothetical protein